jgi:multiple sugar transport system permease protein
MVRGRLVKVVTPYLLALPLLCFVTAFVFYPMVRGIIISFFDTRSLVPAPGEFRGFFNYLKLFTDGSVIATFRITLIYVSATVLLAVGVGLSAALFLDMPFRGRGIARAVITIPWGTPLIAAALIWSWMLDPQYGVVNFILRSLHLIRTNVQWLVFPRSALFSVIMVDVWRIFPFGALVLLTALQSVDQTLYDAAKIDGASSFRIFRHIALPWISPSLRILTLLYLIWGMKRFDTIWVMTQGGPINTTAVLAVRIYREAFQYQFVGRAAALAALGSLITILVTIIYIRSDRDA